MTLFSFCLGSLHAVLAVSNIGMTQINKLSLSRYLTIIFHVCILNRMSETFESMIYFDEVNFKKLIQFLNMSYITFLLAAICNNCINTHL